MYVITVLFSIKPAYLDKFLPEMLANAATSLKQEPGCLQFDVCQSTENTNQVYLYEVYQHQQAFDEHLNSAHFLSFNETTKNWIEDKQISSYIQLK